MRLFKSGGITFGHNPDLSGNIIIRTRDDVNVEVPADAFFQFAFESIRCHVQSTIGSTAEDVGCAHDGNDLHQAKLLVDRGVKVVRAVLVLEEYMEECGIYGKPHIDAKKNERGA